MNQLGNPQARVALYLENRPVFEQLQLDAPTIIAANGNHWRKILTIWSKLLAPCDWREYRDHHLLQRDEQLIFETRLAPSAQVHILSGKACWTRFSVDDLRLLECCSTSCGRAFYQRAAQGLMIYAPYFDYRQLPNSLIAELREVLQPFLAENKKSLG